MLFEHYVYTIYSMPSSTLEGYETSRCCQSYLPAVFTLPVTTTCEQPTRNLEIPDPSKHEVGPTVAWVWDRDFQRFQ